MEHNKKITHLTRHLKLQESYLNNQFFHAYVHRRIRRYAAKIGKRSHGSFAKNNDPIAEEAINFFYEYFN